MIVEAAYFRAQLHLIRGGADGLKDALADFDFALAHKLDYPLLHLNRARIFLALDQPEKAIESLNAYLAAGGKLDLKSGDASFLRGKELGNLASEIKQGKNAAVVRRNTLELAAQELQNAVKQGNRSARTYDELGLLFRKIGKPDESIKAHTLAVEKDPKNARVLVHRGWTWEDLKVPQYEKASKDFAAAVELDPEDAEAHVGLGYMQACLKDGATARRHANLALLQKAGDYLILHNVACIYATLSRHEPNQARELQDMTLDLLRREIALFRKDARGGPDPVKTLIPREGAFPRELKARPEFRKLLEASGQ
jgi:tetratricopeptide (TPR) repeat protein